MPSPAHIDAMKAKALAALVRQDGIDADRAEFVPFKGEEVMLNRSDGTQVLHYRERYAGQYIVLYGAGDDVLAVYKVQVRPGPAKAQRTADGGVIYMVNSLSIGVKRIKRPPKGLLAA